MENIPNLLQNFASLVNLFYFKVTWILLLLDIENQGGNI